MAGKKQNISALVLTLAATAIAKKIADTTWKIGAGKEPPTDPADPDIELKEAVVWAIVSGAIISLVRMFISRRFAKKERRQSKARELAARRR
jgi:hypothetical protein